MINESNNPWAGLASYEDPAKSVRKLKFCGRDNDIYDVSRLIDDNLLLILYGKSGIGKTSLLNAGVFPKLRQEQYLPVSIRLGTLEADASYQEAIIIAIENAIKEIQGSITVFNVVEEQTDNQQPDRLWNYFARHRFNNVEQQPIFPVVVLDQFEEVLRNVSLEHDGKAQILLNQLQYLIDESHALNDCIVDGKEYFYDFNFRFVISIREDELYLLEDNIDDLSLSMFRNCRYRLRSLSEQGATEAILVPGKDCIVEEQKQAVVDRIIALSKRPQNNDIDTLLLSLVCSGTYDKKIGEKITLSDLAVWKDNPMRSYYDEAILSLQDNQIRFIQKNLIKKNGTRERVKTTFLKETLGGDTFDILSNGSNKILNILPNEEAELLHDQLALVIFEDRDAYEERERNWRFMEMQSRFVAEKAKSISSDDAYLARLLAVEVLPQNLGKPERPYTAEAALAIREACNLETAILRGHKASVHSVAYSHDGKRIVSGSRDKTIIVWDAKSGARIKVIDKAHNDCVSFVTFSPDDKSILSVSWDGSLKLFNAETYNCDRVFVGHEDSVLSAAFSPNGRYIISASKDKTVLLWDRETGERTVIQKGNPIKQSVNIKDSFSPVAFSSNGNSVAFVSKNNTIIVWNVWTKTIEFELSGHSNTITSVSFSPNGNRILSSSFDKTIKIWSTRRGNEVMTLAGHKSRVFFSAFSSDNKYIVSTSYNFILIWDASNGKVKTTFTGHNAMIHSVAFSPDGTQIVSSSRDGTVRVWESYLYYFKGPDVNRNSSGSTLNEIISYNNVCIQLSQDNVIRLYDTKTEKVIARFKEYCINIVSASFSPNGEFMVSVSHEGDLFLWNVANQSLIWSFHTHSKNIKSVCFNADGSLIVATTHYGEIGSWPFPPSIQELIDQTRERFKDRPLTPEERRTYYLE